MHRPPTWPTPSPCLPSSTPSPEVLDFEKEAVLREGVAVCRARRAHPRTRRLVHRHDLRRTDHRRPRQGRRGACDVGGLPAPGNAGLRRRRATTPPSSAPITTGTTRLDGRLLGAPAMERTDDFDKADYGLPPLAVEEWQGFVFVNLDADAAPLAPTLAQYEPLRRATTTSSMRCAPARSPSRGCRGTGR